MTFTPCSHEKEVSQLLARGLWPQASSAELSAHVSSCRCCGDLVQISQLFRQARSATASAAPLASPGAIWWRAQLRRRLGALLLSLIPVGLGIVWSLFDDDRLCWHDRLSKTYLRVN